MAPPNTGFDKLFASGFGAVIAIEHASKIIKGKTYEQYAGRGGFTLNAIDSAKALARKYPAISEETVAKGMLSSSPAVPEEDVDTIGLQWLLVAQSKMSTTTAGDLARIIYENKADLALADGFASKIEPADTDKDAFIVAHQGAAEYINDDTKSFMDRYSDLMYLGMATLGIIGSIFAGVYTKITRVAPEKASELATAILDIGERMEHAKTLDQLDALQDELESILRGAVIGLRDGTISSDGLDTFKLGYEFVRDEIGMRRDHLKRHAAQNPAQETAEPSGTPRKAGLPTTTRWWSSRPRTALSRRVRRLPKNRNHPLRRESPHGFRRCLPLSCRKHLMRRFRPAGRDRLVCEAKGRLIGRRPHHKMFEFSNKRTYLEFASRPH